MPGLFKFVQVKFKSATLARLAFIASDRTTLKVFPFHSVQGGLRLFLVRHFNKTKTARPSGFTIVDNSCTVYGAIRLKCFAQDHVVHAPSKISYKNIHVTKNKE